jgi:hypothetical protein
VNTWQSRGTCLSAVEPLEPAKPVAPLSFAIQKYAE